MTDNTEAVEKLVSIIKAPYFVEDSKPVAIAQAILAAIRSDPIAYGIRPKPLEWTMYTPEEPAASAKSIIGNYIIDCTDTGWYVAFNGSLIVRKLDGPEAAQAAAHQCKLFVEMM